MDRWADVHLCGLASAARRREPSPSTRKELLARMCELLRGEDDDAGDDDALGEDDDDETSVTPACMRPSLQPPNIVRARRRRPDSDGVGVVTSLLRGRVARAERRRSVAVRRVDAFQKKKTNKGAKKK